MPTLSVIYLFCLNSKSYPHLLHCSGSCPPTCWVHTQYLEHARTVHFQHTEDHVDLSVIMLLLRSEMG